MYIEELRQQHGCKAKQISGGVGTRRQNRLAARIGEQREQRCSLT